MSDHPLLTQLDALSAADTPLSHQDFLRRLKENATPVPLTDWNQLVAFASDQCGRWQARWLFSPASAPDAAALQESQAWNALHTQLANDLLDHAPDVRPHVERAHEARELHQVLIRGLSHRGPVARIWWGAISHVAIFLKSVGFGRLGLRLYSMGLYPSGTVGRVGGEADVN